MIDRRWFLGLLSSIPFLRAERAEAMELASDAIETIEIKLPVYAHVGDIVYCENMHPICAFGETVHVGQRQEVEKHLVFWRWPQKPPKLGSLPIPGCSICGAPWTNGLNYHFADGWRYSGQEGGLRIKK